VCVRGGGAPHRRGGSKQTCLLAVQFPPMQQSCWCGCRVPGCAAPLHPPGGRRSLRMDAFSVWTQFTVQTGKRSELPRGMPLVTRMFASSELAWGPMASSSVNFCPKTRTVPFVQRQLREVDEQVLPNLVLPAFSAYELGLGLGLCCPPSVCVS
jgi:hypothetical protein